MVILFEYPEKSRFGRKIPKNKFYENVTFNRKLKEKFINQIDKIIWKHKLAPNTLNLDATDEVPEIVVLDIFLKNEEIEQALLEIIDNAIPLPIIFHLHQKNKIKIKAAYKRPSVSANNNWIVESYLESDWELLNTITKQSIPQALNLGKLYEAILLALIPVEFKNNKKTRNIAEQISTINQVKLLKKEIEQLTLKFNKEKQKNRQFEINKKIKLKQKELSKLKNSGD